MRSVLLFFAIQETWKCLICLDTQKCNNCFILRTWNSTHECKNLLLAQKRARTHSTALLSRSSSDALALLSPKREERQREKSFDPTLTFHCKVGRLFSLTLSLERDRLNPKRPEGREGKKDTFSLRGTWSSACFIYSDVFLTFNPWTAKHTVIEHNIKIRVHGRLLLVH